MIRSASLALIAVAVQSAAVVTLSIAATPAHAQSSVPARPGRCLRWNFVVDQQGYDDRSRVEITNTCPQPVTGWQCVIAGYAPNAGGCDPRFGSYGGVSYGPRQVTRSGMASNARPIVDLLECPAGFRPTRQLQCER